MTYEFITSATINFRLPSLEEIQSYRGKNVLQTQTSFFSVNAKLVRLFFLSIRSHTKV